VKLLRLPAMTSRPVNLPAACRAPTAEAVLVNCAVSAWLPDVALAVPASDATALAHNVAARRREREWP
jgi:hypothetical protein